MFKSVMTTSHSLVPNSHLVCLRWLWQNRDQNQVEEERGLLTYTPPSWDEVQENWKQNWDRDHKEYCLCSLACFPGLLSYLNHRAQTHLPNKGTTHSGQCPPLPSQSATEKCPTEVPTSQPGEGSSSNEIPSFLACPALHQVAKKNWQLELTYWMATCDI